MKIDEDVERMVRAALDAAVHRDVSRFDAALAEPPGREGMQKGVELAVAICAFVLFDLHDGRPSADQIQELAVDIERQESWMAPAHDEVADFLTALTQQRPLSTAITPEGVVILPYLVAANLLATGADAESGEWWFNYLDKVEAAIEAAGR